MAKKIREKVNDIKIRKKGLLSRMKSMPLTSRFSIVMVICMGIFVLILSGILFKNMKDDVIKEGYNYMKYEQNATEGVIDQSISSIYMSVRIFETDDHHPSIYSIDNWTMALLDYMVNNNLDYKDIHKTSTIILRREVSKYLEIDE